MINHELEVLLKASCIGISLGNSDLAHLSSKLQVLYYIQIANEIAKIQRNGKLLDWGCGYGQMVYLLKNRGLEVIGYEIKKRRNIDRIFPFSGLNIVYGSHNCQLPFENESFAGVLSCGTLEHVDDKRCSLKEIYRVLQEKGYFLYICYLINTHIQNG